MSAYEDYDRASDTYGAIRQPVGLEIILGIITTRFPDLKRVRLLDLGCGPGIYAFPLSRYLGEVRGIDISPGQIARAVDRLSRENSSNLSFSTGDARSIDEPDQTFDAVLISLVLHHVENDPTDRGGHRRVLAESARVLGPGGILILGVCSQAQVYDGAWYCRLMPRASEVLATRHPDLAEMVALARSAGLAEIGRYVPVDAILQGGAYKNGLGPTDPEWRNADSIFALLTPDELAELEERVRNMHETGVLDDFISQHDRVRNSIGQVTFMAFIRDSAGG